MKTILALFSWSLLAVAANAQTVTFETLPVPAAGFYDGDPAAGSPFQDRFRTFGSRDNFGETELLQLWEIEGVEFFNGYTPAYGSWNGFAWSNVVDTTTQGYPNQYAAFPGGGSDGSSGSNGGEHYLIAFDKDSYFNLPELTRIDSLDLTNTTWTALSLANGDAFAKKFGGESGNDEDYFSVTLTGFESLDRGGTQTGSATFYLSDYRFDNNLQDYIVNDWQMFDLSALNNARSVGLTFETTDMGAFGPNTPTYVAIDNLRLRPIAVPEPISGFAIGVWVVGWQLRRRRAPSVPGHG